MSITVSPEETDPLLAKLSAAEGVVTLSVRRGDSVKPRGDIIDVTVFNRSIDEILRLVEESGSPSITISQIESQVDVERAREIRHDVDEAPWEDVETALRHHSRPTVNFFASTLVGGAIAAFGLASATRVTEATALVAAAIIAPVFEPLARVPLAVVLKRGELLREGLVSLVLAYVAVIVGAVLGLLLLRAGSDGYLSHFLHSPTTHEVDDPPALDLILSACGAIIGAVMISAGGFTQLAGPLIALQLLPASAALGMGIESGHYHLAADAVRRLAGDVGLVLVAGLLVFTFKQVRVHRRRTLR